MAPVPTNFVMGVNFSSLLPAVGAIYRCPTRAQVRSWSQSRPESGECRIKNPVGCWRHPRFY